METILKYKNKQGQTLEIMQDNYPEDPRSWDNVGIMLCAHRRSNFGDIQFDSVDALENHMKESKPVVKLPLYLLDHSGYAISTEDFHDPWDSGQLGWIIATKETVNKVMGNPTKKEIEDILISEVKQYDDYLRGNVYMYRITKHEKCSLDEEHEETIESCGGFYCEPEDVVKEVGGKWIEV